MGKLAFLTALQQPQGEGHTRGPRGPCMYPTSLGRIKIMRKEEKKKICDTVTDQNAKQNWLHTKKRFSSERDVMKRFCFLGKSCHF